MFIPAGSRPLLEHWPSVARLGAWAALAGLPTAVTPLSTLVPGLPHAAGCFVKRDDVTSPLYGGNKVRTLEVLLGAALQQGVRRIYSIGAYGSNHAVATAVHAPRLGLETGALLCPQPVSRTAADNLRVAAGLCQHAVAVRHWSLVPLHAAHARLTARSAVMPPGGATPRGALGYVSAAFELAQQIGEGTLPLPEEIVLPVGSTCTTAGLLVGLHAACRSGVLVGAGQVPRVIAVRVTPWPVTARWRILRLAERVAALLHTQTGDSCFRASAAELGRRLQVDGGYLAPGYGAASAAGLSAMSRLGAYGLRLDTTYSAKAMAALLDRMAERPGRVRLFWSTKSSAPLPAIDPERLRSAPRCWQDFWSLAEGSAA